MQFIIPIPTLTFDFHVLCITCMRDIGFFGVMQCVNIANIDVSLDITINLNRKHCGNIVEIKLEY